MKHNSDNFLACKKPIDAMWSCYTEGKYGMSIRDAPAYSKEFEAKFYNCLFREGNQTEHCMNHFTDMVRSVYRSGDGLLCDWYWLFK